MIALMLGSIGTVLLSIIFVLICLLLVFMVVITPSSEGGMAAAFGGMGSDTFFGTKANQHINKFTLFLAVSFLVLAIVLNRINSSDTAIVEGPVQDAPPSQLEEDVRKLRPQDNAPPTPPTPPPSNP